MEDIQKQIEDLRKQIDSMKIGRITQQMITPDVVKMRHMGEGNRFVRGGVIGNRPTTGESGTDSIAVYLDTTAGKLWAYYGGAWHYASFT